MAVFLVTSNQEHHSFRRRAPEVRMPGIFEEATASKPALDQAINRIGCDFLFCRDPPRGPTCFSPLHLSEYVYELWEIEVFQVPRRQIGHTPSPVCKPPRMLGGQLLNQLRPFVEGTRF